MNKPLLKKCIVAVLVYLIITIPYWVVPGFTIYHFLYMPFAVIVTLLLMWLIYKKEKKK
jgi:hypothetical protein